MPIRTKLTQRLPPVNAAFDPAIRSMLRALDTDVELSGEYTCGVSSTVCHLDGTTITIPIAGLVPGAPYSWELGMISTEEFYTSESQGGTGESLFFMREMCKPSHVVCNATGQLVATWGAWRAWGVGGNDTIGPHGRIFVRGRRFKRR